MRIRWPRLTFPPINLWSAPHQSALEDTMTAVAERDAVQEQLCARIDELERDKEVLAAQRHAERATASRDKAKADADQQRERADRLAAEKSAGKKELTQVRHQARQRVQQLEAELARKENAPAEKAGEDPGPHATIKSDDGRVVVQLAFNQVHIHEPDRWYMVSSKPLDKAEKHRMIFCGLIDGIMAGEHATFIKGAIHQLAGHWRKENGCQRIEDLDLPGRVVNQLEDAGYELLSEINTEAKRKSLAGIKGIGPATIQKIARAVRKAGGK